MERKYGSRAKQNIKLAIIAAAALIMVSGCQTVGNIKYVAAGYAEDRGNTDTSFKLLLDLANDDNFHGQIGSQIEVADYYLEGTSVKADYEKYLYWLRRAATNTNANTALAKDWKKLAQYKLTTIYMYGEPGKVERDYVQAARWAQMAAELGHPSSTSMLEELKRVPDVIASLDTEEFAPGPPPPKHVLEKLLRSNGEDVSCENAKKLAKAERYEGAWAIAQSYNDGDPCPRDAKKAAGWTYVAASNGHAAAQYALSKFYLGANDFRVDSDKRIYWLKKSADGGSPDAQNDLAVEYMYPPRGMEKDQKKAMELFEKAAAQNHISALINLGDLYKDKKYGLTNKEKALEYYKKALSLGSNIAAERIAALEPQDGQPREIVKIIEREIIREVPVPVPATPVAPATPKQASLRDLFKSISPSVMKIHAPSIGRKNGEYTLLGSSQGSGVAISSNILLTNHHVIEDSNAPFILVDDKPKFLEEIFCEPAVDICAMRVKGTTFRPITKHKSLSDIYVGDEILAIGSPKGLDNSLSAGLVSGKRDVKGTMHIQFTADISPGSSGGGLFDRDGHLIGITTFLLEEGNSLYFAVPSKQYVDRAINQGR
jgi:TPR repeat protein